MKRMWKTLSLALASSMIASGVKAQDAEETKESKVAVVVASGEGSSETKSSDDEKKVQVHVVHANGEEDMDDILKKMEEQMEKADLPSDIRAKVLDGVRKAAAAKSKGMKSTHKTMEVQVVNEDDSDAKVEVKVDGEVVLQDKQGKQQRIKLQQLKPGSVQIQGLDGLEGEIREKVLKQLKEHGVSGDEISGLMEKLSDESGVKTLRLNPGKLFSQVNLEPRYVLGIALQTAGDEWSEEEGSEEKDQTNGRLTIAEVMEGSAAETAGLEEGDVIISVDGDEVESPQSVIEKVQVAGKEDRKVKVIVLRDNEEKTIEVQPKKEEMAQALESLPADIQMKLDNLPEGVMGGFVLPQGQNRFLWKSDEANEDLEELKEEMDELKKELKEIKKLLKSLKKD